MVPVPFNKERDPLMRTFIRQTTVGLLFVCSQVMPAAAGSEMTYKEYEDQLASVQQREKTAKEEIAQEQGKIESDKQQVADLEQKLTEIVREKNALLGINEQDITAAESEITSLRSGLEGLLQVTPEELANRKGDLSGLESRIAGLKAKPVSFLWKISEQMGGLDQLVEQVKSRLQMAAASAAAAAQVPIVSADKAGTYTVKLVPSNRECLYLISGYDFVYGDPAKWPYLYRANQSIIDRGFQRYKSRTGEAGKYSRAADLIFPGQVLDIPR
jgi:nucleoid-associated protein YgaU